MPERNFEIINLLQELRTFQAKHPKLAPLAIGGALAGGGAGTLAGPVGPLIGLGAGAVAGIAMDLIAERSKEVKVRKPIW